MGKSKLIIGTEILILNLNDMLICKLSDQLGNQMFAYAAVKTIALDKGYDFGVYKILGNQFLKNSTDMKYGNSILNFPNIKDEIVSNISSSYKEYQEITTKYSLSSMQESAWNVGDDTIMKGHYISPLYFNHRIAEVRSWFSFPTDIEAEADDKLQTLRNKYPANTLFCSVHFRNALDYRAKGYMLSHRYWNDAAKKVKQCKNKVVFVTFYDRMTPLVKKFTKRFHCEISHNSLFVDFCMISKCDSHIICNSSYSVMSALMDRRESPIYCPSIWPIPKGLFPVDAYPQNAIKIPSKRNYFSYLLGYITPHIRFLKYLFVRK